MTILMAFGLMQDERLREISVNCETRRLMSENRPGARLQDGLVGIKSE